MMHRVLKNQLKSEYQTIEEQLTRYCREFPEYDVHLMLKEVLLCETVMWAGEKSFLIGSPVDYHNQRKFLLECAAGDLDEILSALPDIEKEAQAWGFSTLEICGRLGWDRVMKDYGFRKQKVILSKTLGECNGRQE